MNTIRIRKDGRFTLPATFRKKYGVKTGDSYYVIEIKNGLLFKPARDMSMDKPTEKLSGEIKTETKSK
jgi:bifunctional DNA-binding transcriptional regulator/antitoxin component of YhaV-PrlF toxin-antitoxin module